LTIHKNKAGQRHAVITLTTVFESQWEILLTNGKNVNDLIVCAQNAPKIDEKIKYVPLKNQGKFCLFLRLKLHERHEQMFVL